MRKEIKDLQKNAVNSLIEKMQHQHDITFKAPTGSGKTYMMADFMNEVLNDSSVVFLVSSLSKAGLGKQNYEKFLEYNIEFSNLNPYLINSDYTEDECVNIPDGYNVYVLPRDLYKDRSILKDSGALFNFIITTRFAGKRIYLIKDECHQATNNLNDLNEYFEYIINFSATPKFKPDVEITVADAEEVKLIKTEVPLSDYSRDELYSISDDDSIENTVEKFIKVKDEYARLIPSVNPCLIIQISNKEKADQEWKTIKKVVDDPARGLKWAYIVDEKNSSGCETNDDIGKLPVGRWKDFIKENNSLVDIIIFKMVITEGWDIPRACMLYQVRDSQSKQLDEQVIGRVKRNPILLNWEDYDLDAQQLALSCWIWGITEKSARKFNKVTLIKSLSFNVKTTKISDISSKNNFNLKKYLKSKPDSINVKSIFDLYKKWNSITPETYNICWNAVDSYKSWEKISNYIDEIDKKNNEFMSDYSQSMLLDSVESFADSSYFEMSENMTEIDDWSWELLNNEDDEYCFDSYAEKEFAKVLKRFHAKKWGKNFYPNSKIKFEYMLYSKHNSFPDFIVQDKNKKVHIFEVKSFNKAENLVINSNEYNEKVLELCKMYAVASSLTTQVFYIPIMYEDKWKIYQYKDGNETIFTMADFKEYFRCLI